MKAVIVLCQGIKATEVQQQRILEGIADTLASAGFVGTTVDCYASDGLLMADITTTNSDTRRQIKVGTSITLNNYQDIKEFIGDVKKSMDRYEQIATMVDMVAGYQSILGE